MTKIEPEALGVGSKFPEVELMCFDPAELNKKDASEITPKSVNTKSFCESKKVVFITITGAFTPVVNKECL